jgi:hypothetical protein
VQLLEGDARFDGDVREFFIEIADLVEARQIEQREDKPGFRRPSRDAGWRG